MALPTPNLDDRTYLDLIEQAKQRIRQNCPQWTDLSEGDPGMVLIELFAYLTDAVCYRLNRLPKKAYIEFLNLMGVRLDPPTAARATLQFSLTQPTRTPVEVPRGTRVLAEDPLGGTDPILFVTTKDIEVGPKESDRVTVAALHCEEVNGEVAGYGTGKPGLAVSVARPPIIAQSGDSNDLVVRVELASDGEDYDVAPEPDGKKFRTWREAENFAGAKSGEPVYVADRLAGTIQFAPAVGSGLDPTPKALAMVPPAKSEIRISYRRGGGPRGNVAGHTLKILKDPITGVRVDNPAAATGGRAAETLENALVRGPLELHSLGRAVTAQDFELIALRASGAVSRARAFTQAKLWRHAPAGLVEVTVVPSFDDVKTPVTIQALKDRQSSEALGRIASVLEERMALGTRCVVNWARCKEVRVKARLVARSGEDKKRVETRILERLNATITPAPVGSDLPGWPFGEALRRSHVDRILLAEPGIAYVEDVHLLVDELPRNVTVLAVDSHQPNTWYAGSEGVLFRSLNDGEGWETMGRFEGETIALVEAHPNVPGWIAVAATLADDDKHSRLHLSRDCGETWEPRVWTLDTIQGMAWVVRNGVPMLLSATGSGLTELSMARDGSPAPVSIVAGRQDLGLQAIASVEDRGSTRVVVAASDPDGLYLSDDCGRSGTYRLIGLAGAGVRVLRAQKCGFRSLFWAGVWAASGADPGTGCFSYELREPGVDASWDSYGVAKGWDGGSCFAIAFVGETVLAATHRAGVLCRNALGAKDAPWLLPDINSGLPLRERARLFKQVHGLAARASMGADGVDTKPLTLAGGEDGIYRATDTRHYEPCSLEETKDRIPVPPNWLLCSGKHEIEIIEP